MNLGQTLLVIAALGLLGILVLNSNRTVLETNETQNMSEYGITAVSLATSLVEDAQGKLFDQTICDTNITLTVPTFLTGADSLGPDPFETYRPEIGTDFNDFDDFNGLVVVYKSSLDSTVYPGATQEIVTQGIRATYIVSTKVDYVAENDLDTPVAYRTWHKRILVSVTSPSMKDTLKYPAIMSFWN
jgi:hypothetical protein